MGTGAIIFDFDGVIALSEPVHCRAWEDLAVTHGRPLPVGFLEDGIGYSDLLLSEQLAGCWGGELTAQLILGAKRENYQRRCGVETTLVPGIEAALERLASHYPIGLATSSSEKDIHPVLTRFGLDRFFKTILTIESITNPKPHPEIYLKAAANLDRAPSDCWIFEDSIHGATAGRSAGGKVIGMTTTYAAEALQPVHACFSDYRDIESILQIMGIAGNCSSTLP